MRMTGCRAREAAGSRRGGPMRRPGALIVLAATVALVCAGFLAGVGAVPAVASVGAAARVHWGRAEPVPGLAPLDKGQNTCLTHGPNACASSSVSAISCWAAASCAAGGFYTDRHEHPQAFVALERKGRWGRAMQVPGTAALNKGGNAQVVSVSCARTSVCVAVGTYTDRAGNGQWFTVTERNRRWGSAEQVPVPALNGAQISTVWCAPGGLCAAGGPFTDSSTGPEAWLMTETQGRWHPALEVPGIAALNVGSYVGLDAISCATAGNCAAAGHYTAASAGYQPIPAFVVTETNGTWGTAQEVPGFEAFNGALPVTSMTAIACPSAGNCAAVGSYNDEGDDCDPSCQVTFVVNERHGTWGQVQLAWYGWPMSLTCPAAGDCVVAGFEVDGHDFPWGELISETNGNWAGSRLIARTQSVNSVSCASAGYCDAGGSFAGCSDVGCGTNSAFVIGESRGAWYKAVTPAGIPARYPSSVAFSPLAGVSAVACPPGTDICTAGGSETPVHSNRAQAFIVSQVR
jgi:hypothetical protein